MNQKCLIMIMIMIMVMEVFPSFAMNQDLENSNAPYVRIRFLQRVLDSSLQEGGYSKKKILDIVEEVGLQLRTTNMSFFADHRNVDAVFIYTIISENISILNYLIANDKKGYFDLSIVHALRKYFAGEFEESIKALNTIKDNDHIHIKGIEPYFYLLMGRAMMKLNSKEAIQFFDRVRLTSSGTVLEEISLRNLLEITLNQGIEEHVFGYIRDYIRQFYHSIYKDNFINLLLRFFLHSKIKLQDKDIVFVMSFLEVDEQRAIYFKIAQHAVIFGKRKIGLLAIQQLKEMVYKLDHRDLATIWLYKDLMNIPFVDTVLLQRSLCNIPEYSLMEKDRNLKKYSEVILSEMRKSSINIDFDHIDKYLVLDTKQHEPTHWNLESFIKKNRQKIEIIDVYLEGTR
ncbi:chemotaxis protein [Candidatus Liberibacter solanacearum]|uniref:Chemotaxis protein motC n=1 Tax=Candidatus Liberibacter solanacearum TaxID=556287 RepID=A0A0F4VP13_9HYPH|nr:chemotaxis protein [Candidatus Liberibacter solanacearum]KJZ81517.1 chemotaxis protein [Candidatus Liberibacter solanacearum]KJZ82417.1 Chemotaxis protein motC [Candidatus Liberibacter solanacearum]KQC49210.1 chemotaxis protein [Candidatus Liberibacter solanacearum]